MSEIILNNFYGGIADSIFENSPIKFDISKHFDIYNDPKRLIPIANVLANNTGLTTTNEVGNFLNYGSTTYALGRLAASDKTKIFQNTGSNGAWEDAVSGGEASAAATTSKITFIEYKGLFYGIRGNRYIWKWNGGAFTDADKDIGASSNPRTNGIIGKATGYLYIPADGKLWQLDDTGGTWSQSAITIPSNESIYGLANYGNYLAILTRNTTDASSSKSYIYIWDFASLLASEVIELPDNGYSVLGVSGNTIIAVGERTTPVGKEISAVSYSGGNYEPVFSRIYPSTVSLVKGVSRSQGGIMYFAVNDTTTGRPYQGIWSIGRKKSSYPLAVSIAYDYLESGGTASNITNFLLVNSVSTSAGFGIFICTEDYLVHKIGLSPSASSASYATSSPISYMETCKYFPTQEAQLTAVSLKFNKLPSAGVATVLFRVNGATDWTTLLSNSTDDAVGHISITVEPRVVTMTIASPAVVTSLAHGLIAGDKIYFTTTGALPTGVTANTTYYVLSTSLTNDTFRFSATSGGTAINSSGSQSGVHTLNLSEGALPMFKDIQFRIESLGGAEPVDFRFKAEEQETLYG